MNPYLKSKFWLPPSIFSVLIAGVLLLFPVIQSHGQNRIRKLQNPTSGDPVAKILLLRIVRAEDERRWDKDLRDLLSARNANVRTRAALAAGRIGNEAAVADLIPLLQKDDEPEVRAMAAFALGEIESPQGAKALESVLEDSKDDYLRARALEALGKIVAALPKEQEARAQALANVVLEALTFEGRRSTPDSLTILLGLTAVLRAKPDGAGPIVAEFLQYSEPRIRANAANTLARLKLKDGNEKLQKLLISDPDSIVRANAARGLGATEDKTAYEVLLDRALKDDDSRVRVSAIKALGNLKAASAATPLLRHAEELAALYEKSRWDKSQFHPAEISEVLEIVTAFGSMLANTDDMPVLTFLHELRRREDFQDPELEIAYVRIAPGRYLKDENLNLLMRQEAGGIRQQNWRQLSSIAKGLATLSEIKGAATGSAGDSLQTNAQTKLQQILGFDKLPALAIPDILQALAAFKPTGQGMLLREYLKHKDVIVRATAGDLLGNLQPDEVNTRALLEALKVELSRTKKGELNDAALAILDALGKHKNAKANEAIKTALDSPDHLIRRKAVAILQANGSGDFSARIGIVQTRNTTADYERALGRSGRHLNAVVNTTKGSFTIELLPEDAPLTVDNFIQLAKRNYFNGITIHRVVPNFVIQDGDPRGDGNGGPGYQIRCEINEVPYKRGAVGMALSGKDTGGSQWFVTHSPQPHLDGGYTVFGNVVAGMEVVDNIARGDVIRSISIREVVIHGRQGRNRER